MGKLQGIAEIGRLLRNAVSGQKRLSTAKSLLQHNNAVIRNNLEEQSNIFNVGLPLVDRRLNALREFYVSPKDSSSAKQLIDKCKERLNILHNNRIEHGKILNSNKGKPLDKRQKLPQDLRQMFWCTK